MSVADTTRDRVEHANGLKIYLIATVGPNKEIATFKDVASCVSELERRYDSIVILYTRVIGNVNTGIIPTNKIINLLSKLDSVLRERYADYTSTTMFDYIREVQKSKDVKIRYTTTHQMQLWNHVNWLIGKVSVDCASIMLSNKITQDDATILEARLNEFSYTQRLYVLSNTEWLGIATGRYVDILESEAHRIIMCIRGIENRC